MYKTNGLSIIKKAYVSTILIISIGKETNIINYDIITLSNYLKTKITF